MKRKPISDIEYTGAAIILKPGVFQVGEYYIAELKQRDSVVMGSGETIEEALEAWEINLQDHLRHAGSKDAIVQYVAGLLAETATSTEVEVNDDYVEEHLATIKDPLVAAEVKRFYDQFKR